jgi:MoxR-like ATPase
MTEQIQDWKIFQGGGHEPHDRIDDLPPAPSWRPFGKDSSFGDSRRQRRGETFQTRPEEVKMVNAALYLRRPLLITGKPGTGKSSLAYAVARELKLGEVLYWPITTRTTLKDGLYAYDAIGRLQEAKQSEAKVEAPQKIADYITLGPLGTALFPSERPRVLIIDEIDKSDIDLPNDLLTIFEEGYFEIPELLRLEKDDEEKDSEIDPNVTPVEVRVRTAYSAGTDRKVTVKGGKIACIEFPLVILTSNGERDFPPPFMRRCLRLNMRDPNLEELKKIVGAHLKGCSLTEPEIVKLITDFIDRRDKKGEQLATDQLLNALFMITRDRDGIGSEDTLIERLVSPLDSSGDVKIKSTPSESKVK